jgi:ABC-type sugar transport system substrate-binding protein
LAAQTIGYLRTHPQINYLIAPYDPAAAAIVPAMAQAGITNVKVCSLLGDQQNLNFIRKGQIQDCDAAFDNGYMGWAMVDQLIRYLDHTPFAQPLGENTPLVLLDKSNLPKAGTDWQTSIDYQSHYKKLWKG